MSSVSRISSDERESASELGSFLGAARCAKTLDVVVLLAKLLAIAGPEFNFISLSASDDEGRGGRACSTIAGADFDKTG